MINDINDENKVVIQGQISAIYNGDFSTSITVRVRRAYIPSYGKGIKDDTPLYNWVNATTNDAFIKENIKSFKPHDNVRIEGRITVRPRVSKITGSEYYEHSIAIDRIEKAESVYGKEFGIDTGDCEQYAIFKLTGEITRIVPLKNTVSIYVRTLVGRDVNNIQTSLYANDSEETAKKYKEKDIVTIAGNIQVARRTLTDGKAVNRKNFVISHIEKKP